MLSDGNLEVAFTSPRAMSSETSLNCRSPWFREAHHYRLLNEFCHPIPLPVPNTSSQEFRIYQVSGQNRLWQIDTSDLRPRSVAFFPPAISVISFQLSEPSFVAIGQATSYAPLALGPVAALIFLRQTRKIYIVGGPDGLILSLCRRYRHSSFAFQSSIHYPFAEVDTHSILLMLWTERTSDE